MPKTEGLKTVLYRFMKKNPNLKKNEIAKHMTTIGYSKASVYRWIKRIEENKSLERKKGSGRKAKIATKATIAKVKKFFDHKSGCSQRRIARRLGCSHSYVNKILKEKTTVRYYKKIKKPNTTAKQKEQNRSKCRRILEDFKNFDFLIDDESYFTLTHSALPGNSGFYSSDKNLTPPKSKYKYQDKYPTKILVWLCISPRGVSTPFFVPSGQAVNQFVYLDGPIKKHLVPFINKYYPSGKYVFWPDLANAHYANSVLNYLKDKNIPVVPKKINPANVPKARPIEDFWANLKAKVYEGDWTAKTLEELKRRIKYCLGKMEMNAVQKLAGRVRNRLDQIRRYGDID
jgi:transposase